MRVAKDWVDYKVIATGDGEKLENWQIPADFNYDKISLCNEARAKLEKIRPTTLAQASRIDGVTISEIALLQIHLTKLQKANKKDSE